MWDLHVYADFRIFYLPTFFYSVRSRTQLNRTEIANFAPVSWAMLLNSKEFRSEVQLKYTVLREALASGA